MKQEITRSSKQVERIKAFRAQDNKKVEAMQKSIMCSLSTHQLAVKIVKSNAGGKTPGLDGMIWETKEDEDKAVNRRDKIFNGKLEYKASELKTVMVPKPNTTERRPLRIPTMLDRAMQIVYKFATDPLVEENSDNYSYGFRKGRSTSHAIAQVWSSYSAVNGPRLGFETDIEKCFDRIPHKLILEIAPNLYGQRFLIEWLRAGSLSAPFEDRGAPQGSIISPMRCNMVLNGREPFVVNTCGLRKNEKVIRYADDIVVIYKDPEKGEAIKRAIETFLATKGLNMKESKTRFFHISEGFDFLGWKVKQLEVSKGHAKLALNSENTVLTMYPPARKRKSLCEKMKNVLRKNNTERYTITHLNPIVRGWCQYYSSATLAVQRFAKVQALQYEMIIAWLARIYPTENQKGLLNKYQSIAGKHPQKPNRLYLPTSTKMSFLKVAESTKPHGPFYQKNIYLSGETKVITIKHTIERKK